MQSKTVVVVKSLGMVNVRDVGDHRIKSYLIAIHTLVDDKYFKSVSRSFTRKSYAAFFVA